MEIAPNITIDPNIHHGKAVITGTRVPISIILGSLAGGMTQEEVIREYAVTKEQIEAALARAKEMNGYFIRYATSADAEILAELAVTSFHQAFDGSSKQENVDGYVNSAFKPEQLATELADPKSTYLIVEMAGQAIGYLKLYEGEAPQCVSDPNAIELVRLYVRQEFLAQKIGTVLIQRALDEARRKGYQTIFLGVWEHNERAKAFYHKWGFARVGEHIFQMGDDPQTDWWMERKL